MSDLSLSCSFALAEPLRSELCKEYLTTFNKSLEDFRNDVATIREWLKTQHHLPEVPSDRHIENFILLNKYRLDKAREKIDMYYTIRSLLPDFFDRSNPKLEHMRQMQDVFYAFPMPKLHQSERLTFLKLADTNVDNFDLVSVTNVFLNLLEIRLSEDYLFANIYVIDLEGLKLGHLGKMPPMAVFKALRIFDGVFSNRVNQVIFLNGSSVVNTFVNMAKGLMKAKLAQRIEVFPDVNILSERFPKDLLPKEYGGSERSLVEFNELWKLKLKDYQSRFDRLDSLRVDESLRAEKLRNDDILGYHGSFKQLDFD